MANISGSTNEKVFSINRWLGLNEHPDGDTRLKFGEASKMVNFKITRDGNLKRRPGMEVISGLCSSYSVYISPSMTKITSYNSPDDKLIVYPDVSASSKPGTIEVVGYSGIVAHGRWEGIDNTIEDGAMLDPDPPKFSIANGVLRMAGDVDGDTVTIRELEDVLWELEEGEFLYVLHNESVYAINHNCYSFKAGIYTLGGYLVTAKPNADNQPIAGMWAGYVGGKRCFLAACNNNIWSIWNADTGKFYRNNLADDVDVSLGVNFFPFDNKVYIQTGKEYYVYDGSELSEVSGYVPVVAISIGPLVNGTATNAGDLYEPVNRLTGKRRVWISPTGNTNKTFQLPEKGLTSVDRVTNLATNTDLTPTTDYTYNLTDGTVTISATLAESTNSYEIQYGIPGGHDSQGNPTGYMVYREQVTKNRFAELYAGAQDTMVVIYGDGTNRFLYSGMNGSGMPDPEYFPDQYEGRIGDSNTPITAMRRHYSDLVIYKTNECWNANYTLITLADGSMTPGFQIIPVNRDKGNEAPGQVFLVDNNPVTCSGTELYHWINSSYYSSAITRDERQARRISDRISKSMRDIDPTKCRMWDDNDNQEFYLVQDGIALVWNYVVDVWYRYDNFPAVCMCSFLGDMFIGSPAGKIYRLSYDRITDDGKTITAEWESGAMDFGADYMRKYSSTLWVGLKPEEGTSVDVCLTTDKKDTFRDKVVSSTKAKIKGQPFMVKTKIKAKKFVYYRLKLSVEEQMPAVTVTNVDFRVRQTGYAK